MGRTFSRAPRLQRRQIHSHTTEQSRPAPPHATHFPCIPLAPPPQRRSPDRVTPGPSYTEDRRGSFSVNNNFIRETHPTLPCKSHRRRCIERQSYPSQRQEPATLAIELHPLAQPPYKPSHNGVSRTEHAVHQEPGLQRFVTRRIATTHSAVANLPNLQNHFN